MTGDGDCYEVAAKLVAFGGDVPSGALLCHGACTGRGKIAGVPFGHAWVEVAERITGGVFVIDRSNGLDVAMEVGAYYDLGECRDVVRYTEFEARKMMAQHEHFGPWHTEQEGVQ